MKKILVTGGAGYVGSVVVSKFLKKGYHVVCVDNLNFGQESIQEFLSNENFILEKININNHMVFEQVLKTHNPYAIIHLAAIVGDPACKLYSDLAYQTNWLTGKWLIDKCIELNIDKFIFASTCSNYGKMEDPSSYVTEDSKLAPISLYAELKVKIEDYMLNKISKDSSFCPTALRFSTVYGMSPRMRFDLTVNQFTNELFHGRELLVFGEQFWRPYCHVDDFFEAFHAILKSSANDVAYEVFNVGDTSENYTKKMLVEIISKKLNNVRVKYIVKDEDPRDYRVNSDKIKNSIGFQITKTVEDGIDEIIEAFNNKIITNSLLQKYYNIPIKKDLT